MSMLKSHYHFHTLSLSHSLSHALILSFIISRHAEQLLFSCLCSKVTVNGRKLQWFFLTASSSSSCEFGVHGAGSQLKIIIIKTGLIFNILFISDFRTGQHFREPRMQCCDVSMRVIPAPSLFHVTCTLVVA